MSIGLLVMAYGTAGGPDDIERYYTDIRGGRRPSPEHLDELRARYAAIGNRFPLLDITRGQAEGLAAALNRRGGTFRAYLGMKHSPPFIPNAVARMRADGIERGVGIVMAPHWSGMSIETYVERAEKAAADEGGPQLTFVRHWHDHPRFVAFLADRVRQALGRLSSQEAERAEVVFSAHSLPQRTVTDGTTRCTACTWCQGSCRYRDQLAETAELVAAAAGVERYRVAWQSAGRTADPWLGPSVEEVLPALAAEGATAAVVCSAGFVSDHLEILYDLDVEVAAVAAEAGVAFVRTEMPNDDPRFVEVLADVVREHLEANR